MVWMFVGVVKGVFFGGGRGRVKVEESTLNVENVAKRKSCTY